MTTTYERNNGGARKRFFVCLLALLCAAALMSGCDGGKKAVKDGQPTATHTISDGTASVKPSDEKQAGKEDAGQSADIWMDFESTFGGIAVETDENGELVSSVQDGMLRCRVTDSRFPTYRKLVREARRVMSKSKAETWLRRADVYFITMDDGLYFVNGWGGRSVESTRQYVTDGGARMRINAAHTAECRKKFDISRSTVDLVRTDGTWKLVSLQNAK